ncbi:MAG: hypothetical protein HZB11_02400 [Candidatus Yonathbacteria bacterium]|nr:hypothetical protein [Candidatus Yonathbacteria bacterium]
MNKKIITSFLSLSVIVLPVVAVAQVGIPCNGPDCTFDSFIMLINNVVKFLIFSVAVPLAAIGFVFAGAKLVLNQDKEGAWSAAKESFWNIGIGFLIMLGSFVLIKLILYQFLNTAEGFTLFLLQ